ncbi:MAG: hypothetical protein Q8N55_04320 [bacterium]|nr:hypothetical protein [bacterium]
MKKVFFIVLILVVIGGGVLVWQLLKNGAEQSNENGQLPTGEENEQLVEELAGWETYQLESPLLGFVYSVQYPQNWYVKDNEQCSGCLANLYIENTEEKVVVAGEGPMTENGSSFKVYILDNVSAQSIEEWIRGLDIPEQDRTKRLGEIQTINLESSDVSAWKGLGDMSQGVEFVENGRFYRIHYISGSQEQFTKDLTIFEQMLASFRITN